MFGCVNVSNYLFKTVFLTKQEYDQINRLNTCLEKEDAEAYGKLYQLQKENLSISATPNLKLIFSFGVQSHIVYI